MRFQSAPATLLAMLLGGLAGTASARPPLHLLHSWSHHHKTADSPAADPAPSAPAPRALSSVPAVTRDFGKTHTTPANSNTGLVPTDDVLIASREELDRLRLEHDDLMSRVQSLQTRLHDAELLLQMKREQVRLLEAQLRARGHQN